jgi:hypothetical protein
MLYRRPPHEHPCCRAESARSLSIDKRKAQEKNRCQFSVSVRDRNEADSRNSGRQDLNPRPSSKQGRPARRNHKPHGVFHSALKSLPEG